MSIKGTLSGHSRHYIELPVLERGSNAWQPEKPQSPERRISRFTWMDKNGLQPRLRIMLETEAQVTHVTGKELFQQVAMTKIGASLSEHMLKILKSST